MDYTVVNLSGSYKINDQFQLWARIENLFDEDYEEVLGYGSVERGFYLGFKTEL